MSVKEFRYTICPVGNASYISANNGFLQEGCQKLGVTPVLLQSLPRDRWHVHFDYQDPALFREGGSTPPIWARSNGTEVILLGLAFLPQKNYILVRTDSQIDSVEMLRGRRLGVPAGAKYLIDFYKGIVQRGFETALAARGVYPSEVNFVELPVTEAYMESFGKIDMEALDSGKVDAIFSFGIRAPQLLNSGKFKAIYDVSANPDLILPINNEYPNILTVSKQLATEAPEVVVEYVKQMILAARWAKTHLPEVLELFSKQLNGTPGEVMASLTMNFHKLLEPELSEKGLLALESQKRFLYDHGYISKDFDIKSWVDDSFLKAALAEIEKEA